MLIPIEVKRSIGIQTLAEKIDRFFCYEENLSNPTTYYCLLGSKLNVVNIIVCVYQFCANYVRHLSGCCQVITCPVEAKFIPIESTLSVRYNSALNTFVPMCFWWRCRGSNPSPEHLQLSVYNHCLLFSQCKTYTLHALLLQHDQCHAIAQQ